MSLLDMLFSAKTQMPTAETALPGRDTPLQTDDGPLRQRPSAEGALSRRLPDRRLRHGLFLGRGADLLADSRASG